MKSNYKAWNIDYKDFHSKKTLVDELKFLVNFAVLAPSSHNSQPWKFEIKDNEIILRPDFERSLPFSDKNHRQLYISLGAALENLLIAANYYNFKTNVKYINTGSDNFSIIISFEKSEAKEQNNEHLVFSIPRRRTNRNKYSDCALDQSLINKIAGFADVDTKIDFILEKDKKDKISDVVSNALITAMDQKDFRKELSEYIKSNITNSPVGMPASGFGIPTSISLFASSMLKRINMNNITKKQDEALLKNFTPAFILISTKNDNVEDWIKSGRIYESVTLEAEKNNIKTAPMAAAIQIGEFYKDLQRILDLSFRPQVFCRVGFCEKSASMSPRLTGDKVTKI